MSKAACIGINHLAKKLGLSRRTIHRILARGELPSLQIGRRRLIRLSDVRYWLAGCETPAPMTNGANFSPLLVDPATLRKRQIASILHTRPGTAGSQERRGFARRSADDMPGSPSIIVRDEVPRRADVPRLSDARGDVAAGRVSDDGRDHCRRHDAQMDRAEGERGCGQGRQEREDRGDGRGHLYRDPDETTGADVVLVEAGERNPEDTPYPTPIGPEGAEAGAGGHEGDAGTGGNTPWGSLRLPAGGLARRHKPEAGGAPRRLFGGWRVGSGAT